MMSPESRGIRCIRSRAVVDLPQPDSPTTPTVSPFIAANETSSTARTVLRAEKNSPRTGKWLVRPLNCSRGWATPPISSIGASFSTVPIVSVMTSVPYVHGRAHAVADEVEADRDRKDHHAGQRRHPRIDIDRGAQRVEHQPPFRLRRFCAQAQELQAGGEDHRHRDQTGGVDED